MNPFEQLLKELGLILNLNLKPDIHNACLLEFEEGLTIQLEFEDELNRFFMGSQIERLNPGTYREKIFKEALKSNGQIIFGKGVLAYSEKNNTLVIFNYFQSENMTGQKLSQIIEIFLKDLKIWKEALQRGDLPRFENQQIGERVFGLKP